MITEFSDLTAVEVAKAINEMIEDGEFPVLTGMQIQSGGGNGIILPSGQMPFINGASLAVMGQTQVHVPMYAMGCPACPHSVHGSFVTGSVTRLCGGVPVVTLSSLALVTGGCGPNTARPLEALFAPIHEHDVVAMPR